MKTLLSSFLALAVLAIAAATTGRAQVISTLSGGSSAGVGGVGSDYGWGQTFQTPGGVALALDQFVVRLDNATGTSAQAFIATWTNIGSGGAFTVTEPMLWTGTTTVGSDNLATFSTGGIALNASTSYAFYIATTSGAAGIPVNNAGPYTGGGAFVWYRTDSASNPSGGSNYTGFYDLQFAATFSAASISPVPEPSTYATIGLALCGVLALVRRRRSGPTAPATATAAASVTV